MLTLDTSGLLAALRGDELHHREAVRTLESNGGPFIIPAGIMAEVAYMVGVRLGLHVLDALLADLETGAFRLDCAEEDLPRVRELISRYVELPLGYADASVIACAERNGGAVLTYDFRHFKAVAREGSIRIVGGEA